MNLTNILKVGDRVLFQTDQETEGPKKIRFNVPYGTEGVVCALTDSIFYISRIQVNKNYKPGVYHKKDDILILLPDGHVATGNNRISMLDKEEENRRIGAIKEQGIPQGNITRLADLPKTKFWEDDKVHIYLGKDKRKGTICSIDYDSIHREGIDKKPDILYRVILTNNTVCNIEESLIELVERGNVWRYYNNEPLSFVDIQDEANFYYFIGEAEEVLNNEGNLFWSRKEVLEGIRNGKVHSLLLKRYLGTPDIQFRAIRFKNEELGKRVATETLKGFEVSE